MTKKLTLWTIYKHPLDYPDKFVARKFILDKPTEEKLIGNSLQEVREMLPGGLTCFERNTNDVLSIVETWLSTTITKT